MRVIQPRYAARLEDLGAGDFVQVRCVCGHEELLPGSGFIQGMKLRPRLRPKAEDVPGVRYEG
jgi:hypothetical protein